VTSSSAKPKRALLGATSAGNVTGIGIWTTGLGDAARSVSATKALPAQISSTVSKAERK
jgi:hypothetical protein